MKFKDPLLRFDYDLAKLRQDHNVTDDEVRTLAKEIANGNATTLTQLIDYYFNDLKPESSCQQRMNQHEGGNSGAMVPVETDSHGDDVDATYEAPYDDAVPDEVHDGMAEVTISRHKFNHERFVMDAIENDHLCIVGADPDKVGTGRLALWNGTRYIVGDKALEQLVTKKESGVTSHGRNEAVKYAHLVAPTKDEAPSRYIAFKNGVLDLETRILRDPTPDLLFLNIIPHDFNPDAVCPDVDKAIREWACGDADIMRELGEIAGLAMYRGIELAGFYILTNTRGANGKSTYCDFLHGMIGDANFCSIKPQHLGLNQFSANGLFGKLLNIAEEVSDVGIRSEATSLLKTSASGGTIGAEIKGGEQYFFRSTVTHLFACNVMPRIYPIDGGVLRRLHVIPFNANFLEGGDPKLPMKLKSNEAYERMIYIGVTALVDALARGSLTYCGRGLEELQQLREDSDQAYLFFHEVMDGSVVGKRADEVYQTYVSWADGMGIRAKLEQRGLSRRLNDLGGTHSKQYRIPGTNRRTTQFVM